MDNSLSSSSRSLTSSKEPKRLLKPSEFIRKPLLPPILYDKDKDFLNGVRKWIDEEKIKVGCKEDVYDSKRFSVYSMALNKVIEHVTVYKDILADAKREYEECISAIKNGQKESSFLKNKIKTLTNLPTTIAGYSRRKDDLERKLSTINIKNEKLQEELNSLKKQEEDPNEKDNDEEELNFASEHEEYRPIPGLTVEEWTNAEVLQTCLASLNNAIKDVLKQQKTSYSPISVKVKANEVLLKRTQTREHLIDEGKQLRIRNLKLKIAVDALQSYRRKKIEDPDFNQDLGKYMIYTLSCEETLQKRLSFMQDVGEISYEDDDPSKEKEAETILEYIDKFNDLFNEGEYEKAAIHAANSPRGVLMVMETIVRFQKVSANMEVTPTPLLLFAEALMHSASAQSLVTDKEMTIVCVKSALDENRPDLVKLWASNGCMTACDEIAHSLVEYSERTPQHRSICLVIAHKIFSETGNHSHACLALFHLHYYDALLDYSKNVANFTKNDYVNLLRICPDTTLVWNLCDPPSELMQVDESLPLYQRNALPLRFNQAVCAMIDSNQKGKATAKRFLDDLYTNSWASCHYLGQPTRSKSPFALHRIVFEETEGSPLDDKTSYWAKIADFCDDEELHDVAIEIKASVAAKMAVVRALQIIAQDEKEKFDYYT